MIYPTQIILEVITLLFFTVADMRFQLLPGISEGRRAGLPRISLGHLTAARRMNGDAVRLLRIFSRSVFIGDKSATRDMVIDARLYSIRQLV